MENKFPLCQQVNKMLCLLTLYKEATQRALDLISSSAAHQEVFLGKEMGNPFASFLSLSQLLYAVVYQMHSYQWALDMQLLVYLSLGLKFQESNSFWVLEETKKAKYFTQILSLLPTSFYIYRWLIFPLYAKIYDIQR